MSGIDFMKQSLINLKNILLSSLKWLVFAVLTGLICGGVGVLFHSLLEKATHLRENYNYLIYFLPFAGLIIVFLFNISKSQKGINTNAVLVSASEGKDIPFKMAPLIFVSTVLTHLFGGSAGREGAALQLGGAIGCNMAKLLKLTKKDISLFVMSGMSGVFSAVFGTPVAAAFFPVEMLYVGKMNYNALFPCLISSFSAFFFATKFGVSPTSFHIILPDISLQLLLKSAILALVCGIISSVFCLSIKAVSSLFKKYIKNSYLRIFTGGVLIIVLTFSLNTYDYNGAGMDVISQAMKGQAVPYAFILKIIFTAVTIGSGFKGGEIVPAFFTGSVFGCAFAPLLGLSPSLGAAIGFIALFCGVVNCPVTSVILATEVFGGNGILIFALTVVMSYIFSGTTSLYKTQKFLTGKNIDSDELTI